MIAADLSEAASLGDEKDRHPVVNLLDRLAVS
jgi:hypothetical protein